MKSSNLLNKTACAVIVILLFACRQDQPEELSPIPRSPSKPPSVTASKPRAAQEDSNLVALRDDYVINGLLPIGTSITEIYQTLGSPQRMARKPIENVHYPDVIDTLVTLFYPTLTVKVYVTSQGQEYIGYVLVEDNKYLKYPSIGIGITESELFENLGMPHYQEGGLHTYVCQNCEGAEESVIFHTVNGTIQKIEFVYYID
jgi:hypothetical protein